MIKMKLPSAPYYDEMLSSQGQQRQHYNSYWQWLQQTDQQAIKQKKEQAELLFHRVGITFNVYGEEGGTERLIPSTAYRALFLPTNGSCSIAASVSGYRH